jgi:hypothetical protein
VKYQPPWGISDPNAPYINGNPAQGQQGSIPPAAVFEQPQREIVGVIERSGFVPLDTDLLQLAKGIRSQRLNYAVDTGPQANQIIVAFDPPFSPGVNPYTPGLTLHVRVRFTNIEMPDGSRVVTINAGGGNARIRRMNGFDPNPGDLTQGAIVTLIYDGAGFQLSNFGGGGGGDNIFTGVNIPYTEDDWDGAAGRIRARFSPPLGALNQGDIIAVKVKNTASGETVMEIDNLGEFPLLPNGGGRMLQGDVVADDVIQFFYDGVDLRFMPNSEINAPVTYTVGPPTGPAGQQQFNTVDDAMAALKRKIIGANGFVTLKIAPTGAFPIIGPITIAHPSGDRLAIEGTMINTPPDNSDTFFLARGNTATIRAADYVANLANMRLRYGTEIRVQNRNGAGGNYDCGIENLGAGSVTFKDLLIVADTPPDWTPPPPGVDPYFWLYGAHIPATNAAALRNITVAGCQVGFILYGGVVTQSCFAIGCWGGFSITGVTSSRNCGSFGSETHGYFCTFGGISALRDVARGNGENGYMASNSGKMDLWYITSRMNGLFDLQANVVSSIVYYTPPTGRDFGTVSPPLGQMDGYGALVIEADGNRPA